MAIDLVYGTYLTTSKLNPISYVEMRIVPLDLVAHWRRCGMTADYLANFMAYHFPERGQAASVMSTILNEMVENSVKFSTDKTRPASFGLFMVDDSLVFESTNATDEKQAEKFARFVRRVIDEDAEDLFVEQLEHTAKVDATSSGVGLITLKKDYGARVGVRIQPSTHGGMYDVAVQIVVDTKEVEGP